MRGQINSNNRSVVEQINRRRNDNNYHNNSYKKHDDDNFDTPEFIDEPELPYEFVEEEYELLSKEDKIISDDWYQLIKFFKTKNLNTKYLNGIYPQWASMDFRVNRLMIQDKLKFI